MKRYLINLAIAVDQLANAITGGDPDETLSSRAAKCARRGGKWCKRFCRIMHWIDPKHCDKSIEFDEGTR